MIERTAVVVVDGGVVQDLWGPDKDRVLVVDWDDVRESATEGEQAELARVLEAGDTGEADRMMSEFRRRQQ